MDRTPSAELAAEQPIDPAGGVYWFWRHAKVGRARSALKIRVSRFRLIVPPFLQQGPPNFATPQKSPIRPLPNLVDRFS